MITIQQFRRARWLGVGLSLLSLMPLLGAHAVHAQARDSVVAVAPLFMSQEPLAITLTANFSQLRRDRRESPERPALVTVPAEGGGSVDVGAELRTRGEFRLVASNCSFPPLRLDVRASEAGGTVLEGQDKLKMVSSCRPGRDVYEQYVLAEYLAYRMYGLLTDDGFRVRLLRVEFSDTGGDAPLEERWGFLIEEDVTLAQRLGGVLFELEDGKNLPATAFDPIVATTNAVFQYMIGNTDWSAVAAHNVEIVDRAGVAYAAPFDFDNTGIVDAPYATTNPDFGLASVRDRYYRGWCTNPVNVRRVLTRFREAQPAILALWSDLPGLDAETRSRSIRYLAAFFEDIETDDRAQRRFLRDCRESPG